MKDRRNLTKSEETGLRNAISHGENIDEFGHLLHVSFTKVSFKFFSQIFCSNFFFSKSLNGLACLGGSHISCDLGVCVIARTS